MESSWLDGLKLELGMIDMATAIRPINEPFEGETVVGVLSEDLQRIYALSRHYERSAAETGLQARFANDLESARGLVGHMQHQQQRMQMLWQMLWVAIKDQYSLWEQGYVGLRQGWQIVHNTHPPQEEMQ